MLIASRGVRHVAIATLDALNLSHTVERGDRKLRSPRGHQHLGARVQAGQQLGARLAMAACDRFFHVVQSTKRSLVLAHQRACGSREEQRAHSGHGVSTNLVEGQACCSC